KMKTSLTDRNPGRRFYGCRNEATNYDFRGWVDPPICVRAVDVIPRLLRGHECAWGGSGGPCHDVKGERTNGEEAEEVPGGCLHRSIDLFVAHKQQRLAEYYLKIIGLEGNDEEVVGWVKEDASLRFSTSTPFKTRHKRKGKGKVNVDEVVLRHTNKVVVTNYRRGFDKGKTIMIEYVAVVSTKRHVQLRLISIVLKESGVMKVEANVGVVNNKQYVLSRATGVVNVRAKRVDLNKMIVFGLRAIENPCRDKFKWSQFVH
ncbi:hypothetical protein Tco_0505896, partial [Tanacetum coccineum]